MNVPTWPLSQSGNGRYLVDANGKPFPICGRTAWDLVSAPYSGQIQFLDDCAARGFNAVEFGALWHDQATSPQAPLDGAGNVPFNFRLDGGAYLGSVTYGTPTNEAPDFATPNTNYWANLDALITYASWRGILCLFFPAYVGFAANHWMVEMTANGTTKTTNYGAFVTNRYKGYGNIAWGVGGDRGTGSNPFTGPQVTTEQALITGMKSTSGQTSRLLFAEWNSESIFADNTDFTYTGGSVTYQFMQSCYSFSGDVSNQSRRAYTANAGVAFLQEEPFDEEGPDGNNKNTAATQPVRRFQWWGWLSSVGGYNCGNGFIWPFNNGTWQSHLNTQNAQDQRRQNDFIRSIPWWLLIPSGLGGMRTLIASGGSTVSAADYVAAACAQDGSRLVIYLPPAHTGAITVDLRSMATTSRARLFDPTTGTYSTNASCAGTFTLANTASAQSFTVPATNSAGDADWVIDIDTGVNPFSPSGSVWCG